jgi:MFS family permease
MDWWVVYGGCALAGLIFGGAASAGGSWLYEQLDAKQRWGRVRDALALSGVVLGSVLLAAGVGAVYGYEAETMAHSWRIGAIWGGAGGALSPWLFRPLRTAAARGIRGATERALGKVGGE